MRPLLALLLSFMAVATNAATLTIVNHTDGSLQFKIVRGIKDTQGLSSTFALAPNGQTTAIIVSSKSIACNLDTSPTVYITAKGQDINAMPMDAFWRC